MDKTNGGPAFPVTPTDRSGQIAETCIGMSLRDYFACHALASEVEDLMPTTVGGLAKFIGVVEYFGVPHYPRALSKARYMWADAMLAERAK